VSVFELVNNPARVIPIKPYVFNQTVSWDCECCGKEAEKELTNYALGENSSSAFVHECEDCQHRMGIKVATT
jgi:hypothetical protein